MIEEDSLKITPNEKVDTESTFGVSCVFDVFKFKEKTDHVPEIDKIGRAHV